MDPIVLHPANTDVSNAQLELVTFDADGTLNPNGVFASLNVIGTTQGDSTFSVPGASGCGPNGDGSFNGVVNAVVGLPSPAGANTLVLEDASSALVLPQVVITGQQFADAWHSAFGATPPTTTTTTPVTTTTTAPPTTTTTPVTTTTTAPPTTTTSTSTTTTTTMGGSPSSAFIE
jgi:hypothetical protein